MTLSVPAPWINGPKCEEKIALIERDRGVLASWTDVLLMACFDRFIMNTDRHLNNVMLTNGDGGLAIWATDHDKAIFNHDSEAKRVHHHHGMDCGDHALGHEAFARLVQAVRPEPADWKESVRRIAGLADDVVREAVHDEKLTEADLSPGHRNLAERILLGRRNEIRTCIRDVLVRGTLTRAEQGRRFGGR